MGGEQRVGIQASLGQLPLLQEKKPMHPQSAISIITAPFNGPVALQARHMCNHNTIHAEVAIVF